MPVWTISVGGTERKYTTFNFERKVRMNSPPEFKAQIEYANDIHFFDIVKIERDDVTEWKGILEEMEIEWNENGRYLNITGRDTTFLLWRKYTENFTDMQEDTQGFFGSVNASELIQFLLRNPRSDLPTDGDGIEFKNNKQGWGIDVSRISALYADRTAYGDIDWTILRKRGLGWRNTGDPYKVTTKEVDAQVSNQWTNHGSSPYLDDDDDTNYISSDCVLAEVSDFSFENLTVENATAVNGVRLIIKWKPAPSWWWWYSSNCEIQIWVESEADWYTIGYFGGKGTYDLLGNDTTPWRTVEFDLQYVLQTVANVNAAKIRFVEKSTMLSTKVTWCYLSVSYVEAGSQSTDDWVSLTFDEESIVGIYVESRFDNDSFPRNYKITTTGDKEKFTTFAEVDPNNHILKQDSDETCQFDSYQNEAAYFYKDYGINGISDFEYVFSIMVDTSEPHPYAFLPFCICNNLEDYKTLIDTAGHYFIALEIANSANVLSVRARLKDSGGIGSTASATIVIDTRYWVRVKRSAGTLTFKVYSSPLMREEDIVLNETLTLTDANLDFRYREHAITYNGLEWASEFLNSMEDGSGWSRTGGVATRANETSIYAEGAASQKITATAGQGFYFEEDIPSADDLKIDAYVRVPAPSSEAVNVDKVVNLHETDSDPQAWTGVNTDPYLHDDDENNRIVSDAVTTGNFKDIFRFADLDSKYGSLVPNSNSYIRVKAKLYDGVGGHATYIRLQLRLYVYHSNTWETVGNADFSSTEWSYMQFNNLNLWLTTLTDWNLAKIKLDVIAISGGGSDKGGIEVTYSYLHCEGTGYMGSIFLMKTYDHDVTAGPDPSTDYCGGVSVVLDAESSDQPEKWRWKVDGFANGGLWLSQLSTEYPTADTFYRIRLYTKKSDSGTGYFKLYKVEGVTETLLCERTGLSNSNYGSPDRYTFEATFGTYNSGSAYLDWTRVEEIRIPHSLGYVYTEYEEETIVNVTGNIYRDIIHSWSPRTINNLKISLTQADASCGWAISQIYIYKAEALKYRVILDDEAEPATPPPYLGGPYIKEISIDSPYVSAIGPLNISQNRLFDVISELCNIMNDSYVPYEWWIEYNDNNTFHMASRRGSDLSNDVVFSTGVNMEKVTYSKSITDTVQRVRVIGRGEGKRQDDVSSPWREDSTAMDDVRGFIEDVETEKSVANPDVADTLAYVKLELDASPKNVIVCTISNDTFNSMDYDVGDDVTIIDALTEINDMYRIYNIKKSVDADGEIITLYVDSPYVDVADVYFDIWKKLKQLGIVGTVAADWSGESTDQKNVDANKLSPIFDITAKNEEALIGNDKTDPKWWSSGTGGASWDVNTDNMVIYGGSSGAGTIEVECRYKVITNSPRGGATETVSDSISIAMNQEPKFTVEFKVWEPTGADPTVWQDNDYVEFGSFNVVTTRGFKFQVKKESGSFIIYAVSNMNGTWVLKKIRTISANHKYKCEIIIDYDGKTATFNVYDVESSQEFPCSAVTRKIEEITVTPLYGKAYGVGGVGYRCIMHFYNMRCEHKLVI
jgi:hypothetical protein